MAVVREFTLPDLGEGLTEATIVHWLVEVGEVVAIDQPVVEVETAKAMVEVPCPYGGVVTARFGEEGAEVPVGEPLVTVAVGAVPDDLAGAVPGTEPGSGAGAQGGAPEAPAPPASSTEEDSGSGNVLVGYGTGAAAARRRRIRPGGASPLGGAQRPPGGAANGPAGAAAADRAPGVSGGVHAEAAAVGPAGTTGANGAAGAGAEEAGSRTVPVISPLVRRMARENGLDLSEVTGSGRDGLILRTDVECAIRERELPRVVPLPGAETPAVPTPGAARPAGAAAGAGALPDEERIPLKGMVGAAAEKFSRSRREIPEATCWVDADATELLAARRAMNVPGAPKVSLLALLARICTAALARFPQLNATVDTKAQEIVRLPAVHLGFAAQTERGLVVPVVRDAHARTVEDVSAEIARLTETARAGGLSLAELTHGTFTLNNYGVFGVDGSTPIINHPEAAMLGVGRIAAKPWVHEGELAVRQVVQLSLTFDHRVCDGGTAGGFLRFVADCVEQPALLLRTL
ncbi:pyruvate dehydrogenase E2 component (dihydrolipoamide acetyltransferase) [Streptomyces sp. 2333.5]|uniref:dihydrolipoamide acetyltransferase family protein n=1 Tax=unclassified Streptomyces TaxID=2593676 RepID=UPI000894FA2E|nr:MULTISPECIES: dihydrolipoamide acetyltransferase family protein [unclassified Streptomyces]PJJ03120.1 pyruvate dehydrogenase E2 component (dihydrolipoamide acetyltransferase) [Streptomyces sp. 2333.5]SED57410.1 pyruvate dehydrogenase E2 component (dihydrolipoamide acetyltransferase) [Streptomyces sp. 2314.4]SEE31441.1 pyruvate dehydrogenase E2 component (dihydrolipoamide acetyltransferase) [Streptomyces sp. 2112.2]